MKKNQTHTDSENSQQDADGAIKQSYSNGKMLVEKYGIENTPFQAIKWKDERGEQWILALQQYRLTPSLPSQEAAEHLALNPTWELYMAVMNAMIKEHELSKQLEETIKLQQIANERNEQRKQFESND